VGWVSTFSEQLRLLSRVARWFPQGPPFALTLIHQSVQNGLSANFAVTEFYEVRLQAARFGLTYAYGDKVRYSTQAVLLVLVALGRASVEKDGRSYVYQIKG
jgi:hypothetical protein